MEKKVNIKELDKKERLPYIWEYYKMPIIGVIAVIVLIIYIINRILTPKKTDLMDLAVVNSNPEVVTNTSFFNDFLEEQGYDTADNEIAVNSNLSFTIDKSGMPSDPSSMEVLVTLIAADSIDAFMADETVFEALAQNEMFISLENVASEEFLEEHKDSIIYTTDEETGEKYPVGLILPETGGIMDTGMFLTDSVVVGFAGRDEDRTVETQFLQYLFQ